VIPKSGVPAHIDENLAALELKLTQADLAALDRAFPPPKKASALEML
jgi:diketogulonate reductase-like aldo/keto reductase